MSITTMTFAARDFSARRGASEEHTLQGSVRSEQRSLAEKELPPEGLRRIWPVAALLVGHRSTSGYAPSSRLATGQIRRNERHRSYVHDHLVRACFENGWRGATRSRLEVGTTRRPEVASNVAKRPSLLAPYWLELPLRFPSGESPDGTGESPVLPANPFSKHALRH